MSLVSWQLERLMADTVNQVSVPNTPLEPPPQVPAAGHCRWVICGLLFFAATVNYIDRQVIGLLKPTLQAELHWDEIDYSNIVFAFQLAYAAGLLLVGRVMDWLGTRRGFSLSVFLWSLAAMAHALVRSVFGFGAARFALGLGESGDRKSTRLNSSHANISYAVFCLKKKK